MRTLWIALLFIAAPVSAELSFTDLTDLIAEKTKESKGAYTFTLDSKHGGALYLPMYTLHSKDKASDYLEFGVGGQLIEGGIKKPFVNIGTNIPALSMRVWRSKWRKDHVRTTKLPPIWIGPFLQLPTGALQYWKFRNNFGVIVSIALGAPWK